MLQIGPPPLPQSRTGPRVWNPEKVMVRCGWCLEHVPVGDYYVQMLC